MMLPACILKRAAICYISLCEEQEWPSARFPIRGGYSPYLLFSCWKKSNINSFTSPCVPVSLHMLTIWGCYFQQHWARSVPFLRLPMVICLQELFESPVLWVFKLCSLSTGFFFLPKMASFATWKHLSFKWSKPALTVDLLTVFPPWAYVQFLGAC